MNKRFVVIRISSIAVGVGFEEKTPIGIFSEKICETLFDTGNDIKDAEDSEKWANLICDVLNSANPLPTNP